MQAYIILLFYHLDPAMSESLSNTCLSRIVSMYMLGLFGA